MRRAGWGNCGSFPPAVSSAGFGFTLGSSSAQFGYDEAVNIRDVPGEKRAIAEESLRLQGPEKEVK